MTIASLLNIGSRALNALQSTIAATSNNVANVETPGYSRRYVRLEDAYSHMGRPGAEGQGVNAVEVLRYFDAFVEKAFLNKSSTAYRWARQHSELSTLESFFNESNRAGISSSIKDFFNKSWMDVSKTPDLLAARQSLLSQADSLTSLLRNTRQSLAATQQAMDEAISTNVDRANELIDVIASLNKSIAMNTIPGVSNPNDLLDKRDLAVRELSQYVDVDVRNRDGKDFTVTTKTGLPLVQGSQKFSLQILPPRAEADKATGSAYTGDITFEGSDSHEYTVEIVRGGNVPSTPPPSFRVSPDGGKTWLRDDNGQEIHYQLTDTDNNGEVDPVQVKNLKISFSETNNFNALDRFTIMPKTGLYWIEPTRGPLNITPQAYMDGTENAGRLAGGSLAALFAVRDEKCGRYLDELNALSESLIWEVNRLHSTGAGLKHMTRANGTGRAFSTTAPLGAPQSGLPFFDRLTGGNVQFALYRDGDRHVVTKALDFDPDPAKTGNFDPAKHSLDDVAAAINRTFPNQLTAAVLDGKLIIESDPAAAPPVSFSVAADTAGLMAALGVNTFFQGSGAADIQVNGEISKDLNRICAGAVNGADALNPGDNKIAKLISALANIPVRISTAWRTADNQSLHGYYSKLTSVVGGDASNARKNAEIELALAKTLNAKQDALAGVNMNEEMANLIKSQHSFTAASKLITTSDQMFQTILGMKQ